MSSRHLFIADLHLDRHASAQYDLALRFLHYAQSFDHLYILGDLFEYWLGDDAGLKEHKAFVGALKQLSLSDCGLSVMLGNRDFLLGHHFAEASGAKLVRDDEMVIELGGLPVLLMHGDTLCTQDHDYQRFRSQVRDASWQKHFLNQSIEDRVAMATSMRKASQQAGQAKQQTIMDVHSPEVRERLKVNACSTLIHGHTHRPAHHELGPDLGSRWVVGDWHPQGAQYIKWDGTALSLNTFPTDAP